MDTKHNPYFWIDKYPNFDNIHNGHAQVVCYIAYISDLVFFA